MKLYSYKIVHDDGFAPNPYFGLLTLATCKPAIRRGKIASGDWLSGWSSTSLKGCQTKVGEEKLIYIAKVARKIPFEKYWEQYPQKHPIKTSDKHNPAYYGDNIYKPDANAPFGFVQIPEANFHNKFIKQGCNLVNNNLEHDLSGKYVLVCEEYYYFSHTSPLTVPKQMKSIIKPPTGRGTVITYENIDEFIAFVRQNIEKCILFNK